jgi:quercetin dioxygenase-like cupin family protein
METRRFIGALSVCVGIAFVLGVYDARAQQQAGAAAARPTSENVAKVNLAEVGLPDGAASVTRFVYAPGKVMAPHTHTGRTSIITIVQGQLTEHRGTVKNVYKAGDVITVAEGATHANENAGPGDLIYVEVNITGTLKRPAPAAAPATK